MLSWIQWHLNAFSFSKLNNNVGNVVRNCLFCGTIPSHSKLIPLVWYLFVVAWIDWNSWMDCNTISKQSSVILVRGLTSNKSPTKSDLITSVKDPKMCLTTCNVDLNGASRYKDHCSFIFSMQQTSGMKSYFSQVKHGKWERKQKKIKTNEHKTNIAYRKGFGKPANILVISCQHQRLCWDTE